MKRLVYPADHFLVIDQVTAISGSDALLYACHEAGLPFEHFADRLFHHLGGILAFAGSKFLKLRFSIRSKVDFHAPQVRNLWA